MAITEAASISIVCDKCGDSQIFRAPERVGCFSRATREGWRLSLEADLCRECAEE